MNAYEIPLSPEPQRFSIQLGGVEYRMRLSWSQHQTCWCLEISDSAGNAILQGIPVVTGVDLLAQHRHLGFTGSLLAQTDYDPSAVPTFDNLGSTGRLYFVVE